jgi:hypothetical protein
MADAHPPIDRTRRAPQWSQPAIPGTEPTWTKLTLTVHLTSEDRPSVSFMIRDGFTGALLAAAGTLGVELGQLDVEAAEWLARALSEQRALTAPF